MSRMSRSTAIVSVGLAVLLVIYAYLQPMIMTPFGIRAISNHSVGLALATIGQLTVLIVGGIDLSIGAIIALTNCFAATYLTDDPVMATIVCFTTLVIGAICGMLNGLLIVLSRVQPIIVTLATSYVFVGISLFLRPSPGGTAPEFLHDLLSGSTGYLPHSLILLVSVIVLFWQPLFRTRMGNAIYCVGDNESAAFLSGLPVFWAKITAYTVGGLVAAVAGLFLTAETTSGDANIGNAYTLGSIAAAVLGGASLAGGRGWVTGPVIAAILVSVLIGVLFVAGISTFYQNVFQGGILLLVLLAGHVHLLREKNWLSIVHEE